MMMNSLALQPPHSLRELVEELESSRGCTQHTTHLATLVPVVHASVTQTLKKRCQKTRSDFHTIRVCTELSSWSAGKVSCAQLLGLMVVQRSVSARLESRSACF